MKKILLTGCAGFIGFSLCKELLKEKIEILGIDNINNYYDQNLKKQRLKILSKNKNFKFKKLNIADFKSVNLIFKNNNFDYVINLAAQAGVRYSIEKPENYIKSNINGFFNIIESIRINKCKVKNLIYASSSSVYGDSKTFPLKYTNFINNPESIYALTKTVNELIASQYSNHYGICTTGIRYFTVYGPWGRPDMAMFKFVKAILTNKRLFLFNNGNNLRDFTFIDDAIDATKKLIFRKKTLGLFKVYNVAGGRDYKVKNIVKIIEKKLDKKSKIVLTDKQIGDVIKTSADISEIKKDLNFRPKVNIEEGLESFINWYKGYYGPA